MNANLIAEDRLQVKRAYTLELPAATPVALAQGLGRPWRHRMEFGSNTEGS